MKEEVLQIKTMGEKINNLFKDAYKRHLILVNRKYQRKLVWTIEEKELLLILCYMGIQCHYFFCKNR